MDKNHIETALIQLKNLYQKQDDDPQNLQISQELLCKIAALELCGWLEDTFDDWAQKYFDKIVQNLPQRNDFPEYQEALNSWKKGVKNKIKDTYGLSYKTHFRPLLTQLVGNLIVLQLENEIGLNEMECFSKVLNELHEYRGKLAHKSYHNVIQQRQLDAPEVILQKFKEIYPILEKFEFCLANMPIKFNPDT